MAYYYCNSLVLLDPLAAIQNDTQKKEKEKKKRNVLDFFVCVDHMYQLLQLLFLVFL